MGDKPSKIELASTWEASVPVLELVLNELRDSHAKTLTKGQVILYGVVGGALGASLGSELVAALVKAVTTSMVGG